VTPLVPILVGGAALLAGAAILRSFGPRIRVGRLLVTAPRVSVAEAVRMATDGEARFVGIEGRIESNDEFEDAAHRPLVLRRTRLEARIGRAWRRFEDSLEVVPFEIRDGLDGIAVDTATLDDGLVVLTRESLGVVGDLGDRAPADLPRAAPARARIDQVSTIDHATVLGWPARGDDDRPVMTARGGRPLVLSTLPGDEAMRVLAGGDRVRSWLATILLAGGLGLVLLGVAWTAFQAVGIATPAIVLGAEATPAATEVTTTPGASPSVDGSASASGQPGSDVAGDTRSSGSGPGLVGAPGLAILGLGLVATGLTLAYVRLTGGPGRH